MMNVSPNRLIQTLCPTFFILYLFATGNWSKAEEKDEKSAQRPVPKVLNLPGLICFWNFQEMGGEPRQSRGPYNYQLLEQQGEISRVRGGVWGPYSAKIKPGQWLSIERDKCPALMIHGEEAQYTILAWIKRDSERLWQYIAGVWNETNADRQYAMFVNGRRKTDYRTFTRTDADCQAHAYLSVEGGNTPDNFACFSYATGATRLEENCWYFLAATYDQQSLKVYVDGELDTLQNYNPFEYANKPIYDGGEEGANFTVAQRSIPHWKGYPETPYVEQGFSGQMGGLAVYGRALDAKQLSSIGAATNAIETNDGSQ